MDQLPLFDQPAPQEPEADDGRRSRGAVLVETVLIITVLLVLLFGVAEFGMAVRSKHGLSEATRAGARVAAALPRDATFNTAAANSVRAAVLDAIPNGDVSRLVIYRANGDTGEPVSGTVESCSECYTYLWDETSSDWVLQSGSEWLASTQYACGQVNLTDFVGVHLTGNYDFVTAFFVEDIELTSRTVMRLEPVIGTSQCSPSSNPPPTAAPTGTPTPGPSVTPVAHADHAADADTVAERCPDLHADADAHQHAGPDRDTHADRHAHQRPDGHAHGDAGQRRLHRLVPGLRVLLRPVGRLGVRVVGRSRRAQQQRVPVRLLVLRLVVRRHLPLRRLRSHLQQRRGPHPDTHRDADTDAITDARSRLGLRRLLHRLGIALVRLVHVESEVPARAAIVPAGARTTVAEVTRLHLSTPALRGPEVH